MPTHAELMELVNRLDDAVFGDRSNPIDKPGLVERVRTMEVVVTRIDKNLTRIFWAIVMGFLGAVLNLVLNPTTLKVIEQSKPAAAAIK